MKNPFGLAAWCCVGVDVVWQGTQWPSQEVGLVGGQARSCPALHNCTGIMQLQHRLVCHTLWCMLTLDRPQFLG